MDDQNRNDTADDDVGVTELGEVAVEAGGGPRATPDGGPAPAGQRRGVAEAADERRATPLRRQAGAALAVLGAVLVGVVAFTTPWRKKRKIAPRIRPAIVPSAPIVTPTVTNTFIRPLRVGEQTGYE